MENPLHWAKIMAIAVGKPYHQFSMVSQKSLLLGCSMILNHMNTRRVTKHRDFTEYTLGEFIDLDIYLVMGIEKNLDNILELLTTKPIKYIDEAFYVIDAYQDFRLSTYRSYSGLFGLNEEGQAEDDGEYDAQSIQKGWYKVLVDLSDNNVHQLDNTTDLPLYKALTFMSLRKERALEEQQRQLNNRRKHDLSRTS